MLLVLQLTIPHHNKAIRIDNWRPDIGPRVINVEKETYRYLMGIRGTTDSGWDWESAYLIFRS